MIRAPLIASLRKIANSLFPFEISFLADKMPKQTDSENKIWIRCCEDESRLLASFEMKLSNGSSRTFNLNRYTDEPIAITLERLMNNIDKVKKLPNTTRRQRKKVPKHETDQHEPRTKVELFSVSGEPVQPELQNLTAWSQGNILKIDDVEYKVEVNAPTILSLSVPRIVLAGFAVYPYIDVEFTKANCCKYRWYRMESEDKSLLVSDNHWYTPSSEDSGCKLKLVMVPQAGERIGVAMDVITSNVQPRPAELPFEERHRRTSQRSRPDGLRVVSYNILAEVYSNTDYSRDQLFAYCPNEYLDYDYRKQLILKELIGYNSDIICLQELDSKHYKSYYQPILGQHGYSSSALMKKHKRRSFSPRSTVDPSLPNATKSDEIDEDMLTINEGSAIFFRHDKFKLVGEHNMNIAKDLESNPLFEKLMMHTEMSSFVKEKLLYRSGASLQALVLESLDNPARRLCVSTTHLYFHPKASVVRLFQTAISLKYLQYIKSLYNQELPVVYCGDFNSTPQSPSLRLLINKYIITDDPVRTSVNELVMSGKEMTHDLDLDSACGFPKYTNFTPSFRDCLDYIFYDKTLLAVDNVVPIPDPDILAAHNEGLPSSVFPSDHVALVADLSWKT